ncbi:hypothetical protein BAE44_0006515 [Dichanthelium oligosanthes]|uniref:Uncharacterized protein n=1 Tax=Dichanthelium oligosanthes TaxID=888268 RepID=A0A1E5W555_9POAL|nr:hypothetical protein BAE44_0006515 [Dichanthelium oligosanthes]
MMHSMKDDNIIALFDEVLSWSVEDILKRKQPPFKVETIPNEFKTCVDYRAAFRNPTLEVWYQINSGMDTSSRSQYVQDDGEYGQFADKGNSLEGAFGGFKLNDSQIDAVASCISASTCSKKSSIRLIWGPTGTGKTKTVSVVLLMLLKFLGKHRTLVCAPTNTALVQLASCLISLVKESTEKSHLLQDIIMFGSDKLKTGSGLSEISLDSRAEKVCKGTNACEMQRLSFALLIVRLVIPLAIDGIKHVVLIGDEKQLQSVAMSPIAKEAKYGRSLFERLCEIGWHKKLLDKQYRMHPFISKFPNEMFYDGKIKDVTEAESKLHVTGILFSHYFGNYSFFHVEDGIEEHYGQSLVNMVEVEIATATVKRLAKDMGQDQFSSLSPSRCSQIDIDAHITVDSPVEAAIEEANVDFSPSHTPSRKRPRSLHKELARPEVPKVGEPAPTRVIEATAEEEDVKVLTLEGLPQGVGSLAMKRLKSMTKKAKRANFYEMDRPATDDRFWSIEQEDMYNCIFRTKKFADNKWINWNAINGSEEIKSVEAKFNRIGLDKLIGKSQDWNEEMVRQFFSTVYINPERTFLTWMSGRNRKITVMKRYCEKVLLDHGEDKVHNCKIEDKLTDAQEEELKRCTKDDGRYLNAANRLVRKTIYPRAGDREHAALSARQPCRSTAVRVPATVSTLMHSRSISSHMGFSHSSLYLCATASRPRAKATTSCSPACGSESMSGISRRRWTAIADCAPSGLSKAANQTDWFEQSDLLRHYAN